MEQPLVTIGITAYNAQDTIAMAIQSALAQTWRNTEIIVVDDCSSDDTVKIAASFEIKLIKQSSNQGVAASRNEIIKHAKGEYIVFFDDDDTSKPERIEEQYKCIADEGIIICHTARIQYYPDGTQRYEPTITVGQGEAVALRTLTGKNPQKIFGSTATCSQMAHTSFYKKLNGFDENFRRSEDTDFNIRAALAGAHFVGIDTPLVEQTMTLASDKKLDDEKKYALQLLEKHKDFIDSKTSYTFCYRWLVAKYDYLNGRKIAFVFKLLGLFVRYPILTIARLIAALPNHKFNQKLKRLHA